MDLLANVSLVFEISDWHRDTRRMWEGSVKKQQWDVPMLAMDAHELSIPIILPLNQDFAGKDLPVNEFESKERRCH